MKMDVRYACSQRWHMWMRALFILMTADDPLQPQPAVAVVNAAASVRRSQRGRPKMKLADEDDTKFVGSREQVCLSLQTSLKPPDKFCIIFVSQLLLLAKQIYLPM